MSIHFQNDLITLHTGDALDIVQTLPDESVDCIITSPPYFGLRDYGEMGQFGAEGSPREFVDNLTNLFREARRVLSDSGTLWLNLGDTYYSGRGASTGVDKKNPARRGFVRTVDKPGQPWAKPKSLLGIPWRTAISLQDDGWILRNEIIWHKPNATPESVRDRLSVGHEHLFMFSKSRFYNFDLQAIKVPSATSQKMKNPGDVWSINTTGFAEAHFATFPPELPRRCVLAGSRPGDTVLDPFSGAGTTGAVACENGRRYIGADISAKYHDLALRTRLAPWT